MTHQGRYSDDLIVAYFTAVGSYGTARLASDTAADTTRARRAAGITGCVHSSRQLITDTVNDATGNALAGARHRAAKNPSTDPELVQMFLERGYDSFDAAGNACLDRRHLNHWYRQGTYRRSNEPEGGDAHRGLLTNPHIDREHLVHAVEHDMGDLVAVSAAADGDLLATIVDKFPKAYRHRNCPPELVAAALASDSALLRRHATWNPRHDSGDLATILDAERRRCSPAAGVIGAVHTASALLERRAKPGSIEAGALVSAPIIDRLAQAIADGGDHADAIIALLRAGFDGTADELVDTAAGVTVT